MVSEISSALIMGPQTFLNSHLQREHYHIQRNIDQCPMSFFQHHILSFPITSKSRRWGKHPFANDARIIFEVIQPPESHTEFRKLNCKVSVPTAVTCTSSSHHVYCICFPSRSFRSTCTVLRTKSREFFRSSDKSVSTE